MYPTTRRSIISLVPPMSNHQHVKTKTKHKKFRKSCNKFAILYRNFIIHVVNNQIPPLKRDTILKLNRCFDPRYFSHVSPFPINWILVVNPVISRCEPSFRGPQRRNISIPLLERRGGRVGGASEREKERKEESAQVDPR